MNTSHVQNMYLTSSMCAVLLLVSMVLILLSVIGLGKERCTKVGPSSFLNNRRLDPTVTRTTLIKDYNRGLVPADSWW